MNFFSTESKNIFPSSLNHNWWLTWNRNSLIIRVSLNNIIHCLKTHAIQTKISFLSIIRHKVSVFNWLILKDALKVFFDRKLAPKYRLRFDFQLLTLKVRVPIFQSVPLFKIQVLKHNNLFSFSFLNYLLNWIVHNNFWIAQRGS